MKKGLHKFIDDKIEAILLTILVVAFPAAYLITGKNAFILVYIGLVIIMSTIILILRSQLEKSIKNKNKYQKQQKKKNKTNRKIDKAQINKDYKNITNKNEKYNSIKQIKQPKIEKKKSNQTVRIGKSEYKTVRIGKQLWMAENLKEPSENSEICESFENGGLLYGHEDAMNLCPDGWRLPSTSDFAKLSDKYSAIELSDEGSSGFNAKKTGFRNAANVYIDSYDRSFWTSTEATWEDYPGQFAVFTIQNYAGNWEIWEKANMPSFKYSVRYILDKN